MPPRRLDELDADLARAARALEAFDPLVALQVVALREDPRALAFRGIAMAQLGDYPVARRLLGRAGRGLARTDSVAYARCLAAQGEVALAARDLTAARDALDAAAPALEAVGDRANALFVRLQRVRCAMLLGDVSGARTALSALDVRAAPPRLRAVAALAGAEIAMRERSAREARSFLARAQSAAGTAGIASLVGEIDRAARVLEAPVARLLRRGADEAVALAKVEELLRGDELIVDACTRQVRRGSTAVDLVTRPVLLALATALAAHAPGQVTREGSAERAFGARRATESIRARLRVEIGRLRRMLAALADVEATPEGYALRARDDARVAVLLPPHAGEESALLALLRGGESWSTSALAAAVGTSQRAVQRALVALRDAGRVEAIGVGRACRWIAPAPTGFATTLLLLTRPPAR